MYQLTISCGMTAWSLLYKTKEGAEAAKNQMLGLMPEALGFAPPVTTLKDDFGQEAGIYPAKISGWLMEDMDQSKLAHIERARHQAHTQIAANNQMRNDPVIKAAQMTQGGPGVLAPFQSNGRGFPQ